MVKLRNAICGKKNTNLDDLSHMTGKHSILLFNIHDFGQFLPIFIISPFWSDPLLVSLLLLDDCHLLDKLPTRAMGNKWLSEGSYMILLSFSNQTLVQNNGSLNIQLLLIPNYHYF